MYLYLPAATCLWPPFVLADYLYIFIITGNGIQHILHMCIALEVRDSILSFLKATHLKIEAKAIMYRTLKYVKSTFAIAQLKTYMNLRLTEASRGDEDR